MLTKMTEEDWVLVHEVFDACRSRRGDKGRDDRKFLEALHYFTIHNITWRALPAEFGSWNSIWKRFWRLSRSGVFETFFEALASLSERAHLVQMFELDRHPRACVGGRRKRGQDGEALGRSRGGFSTKIHLNWHSPDNRECAKRVSLISCRDIGHSSYTGIIFRIARLLRLRLPRCGAAVVLRHTKTSDMGGSRTGQYRVGCDQDALLP